jgi:hypothetical protein
MRLTNTGDTARSVSWNDLTRRGFGAFTVPAHSDQFFLDPGGDGASVVRATSGTATARTAGTDIHCGGQITVQLVTVGDAPPGQTWSVRLANGDNGGVSTVLPLAAGDTSTVTVPGGYAPGTAPIDEVVGGVTYTVSVDDPHGALETTISLNPVVILDNQDEFVVVTLAYGSVANPEIPPVEPSEPDQPTLPPAAAGRAGSGRAPLGDGSGHHPADQPGQGPGRRHGRHAHGRAQPRACVRDRRGRPRDPSPASVAG